MKTTASQLLNKAATIMEQRGKQYDKEGGERSMAQTVVAFNAITGRSLSEAEGWLLLAILKMVRDRQRRDAHQDSCEDLVAYASLYGEARLNEAPAGWKQESAAVTDAMVEALINRDATRVQRPLTERSAPGWVNA